MKKIPGLLLLANLFISGACNFSSGFKKDLITGLTFKYNGLTVQNVVLLDPANQPMTSNKVRLNTKVAIAVFGVANYGLKDGKAFPGMMLVVTDKTGNQALKAADLFEGTQGYPPANANELRGDITVAKPLAAGETYHVKMCIWDKIKAGNEINIETDLVVQ